MICNVSIKFGTLLSEARKLGASRLATGHYARIQTDQKGKTHLFRGNDRTKDQSYFLARLTPKQLARACFPVGKLTKSEVRSLARKNRFTPAASGESQDICFIKGKSYGRFLALQEGFDPESGLIQDISGNVLGEHRGLHLFTIGQRRGIGCPASAPYYVVRMDRERNRLVVGFKKDLQSAECRVEKINWIIQKPNSPITVYTRVRYRHKAAASTLFPVDAQSATVQFKTRQSAITPGQGAVFYRDDEVLGGGWIAAQ